MLVDTIPVLKSSQFGKEADDMLDCPYGMYKQEGVAETSFENVSLSSRSKA